MLWYKLIIKLLFWSAEGWEGAAPRIQNQVQTY